MCSSVCYYKVAWSPSGYDAWIKKRAFAGPSLYWIPISGLARSLYKCAVLLKTVYGPSATDRPFENYS